MANGRKTGGRKPGSRNKVTAADKQMIAAAGGELPLDYMLRVMRDDDLPAERRDAMARSAAPYLHTALKSVDHSGQVKAVLEITRVTRQAAERAA